MLLRAGLIKKDGNESFLGQVKNSLQLCNYLLTREATWIL